MRRYFWSAIQAIPLSAAAICLVAAVILAAPPATARATPQDPGVSGQAAAPLRYTLRTIDSEAGTRIVLEFSRKPIYEVRGEGSRVFLTLREVVVEPPFKKRDYNGRVLDKVKFIEGHRASEIVFYAGEEFGSFAAFEMGEPFRIVLDLRRLKGPPISTAIPGPGLPPAASGGTTGAPATPRQGGVAPATPPATPSTESGVAGETPVEPVIKRRFTVVVDPGHGGEDTGAKGPSGLTEKDVTLDVSRRLKARIQAGMDAEVLLTRETDRAVDLDERTAIANHHRADLFVSIHANATRRGQAQGAETYFLSYQETDDDSRAVAAIENNTLGLEEGVKANSSLEMILWDLAQSAFLKESSALAEVIQENLNEALGINNRGIKQAPFRVLMGATMPAVLVEIGFITNPDEERRLRDASFKDRLASALYESVRRYHDRYETDRPR